jgi:hypothetical protein
MNEFKFAYDRNDEERFLSDAILDLQHGRITYVYKENILNILKEMFDNLEITKYDFYWEVKLGGKE